MNTSKYYMRFASVLALVAITILLFPATVTPAVGAGLSNERLKTCRVTRAGGSQAYVLRTERYVHLRKGTILSFGGGRQHQGLILVRARVGGRMESLNIDTGNTNCKG